MIVSVLPNRFMAAPKSLNDLNFVSVCLSGSRYYGFFPFSFGNVMPLYPSLKFEEVLEAKLCCFRVRYDHGAWIYVFDPPCTVKLRGSR